MKFMLQHSIFIIYISCRGNHCDVPAGCVEGQFFSQILQGSVNPELFGMFSELVFTQEERAMCGSCFVLNSSNPRMTKWFRRRTILILYLQYCKVALWDEGQSQHAFQVLLVSGSVPLSQSFSFSEHLLPTWGVTGLCAWHRVDSLTCRSPLPFWTVFFWGSFFKAPEVGRQSCLLASWRPCGVWGLETVNLSLSRERVPACGLWVSWYAPQVEASMLVLKATPATWMEVLPMGTQPCHPPQAASGLPADDFKSSSTIPELGGWWDGEWGGGGG